MIYEIRWYQSKPGSRDALLQLMDDEVIPLMREHGITVVGSYRDLDNENGYLWIRGFDSQDHKDQTTKSVYSSEKWVDDLHYRVLALMDDPSTAVITTVA